MAEATRRGADAVAAEAADAGGGVDPVAGDDAPVEYWEVGSRGAWARSDERTAHRLAAAYRCAVDLIVPESRR